MNEHVFSMHDAAMILRGAGHAQIETWGFSPDPVPAAYRLSKDFLLNVFPGDGLPSEVRSIHVYRRYPGPGGYDEWRDVKKFPATREGLRDAMSRFTMEGWPYD